MIFRVCIAAALTLSLASSLDLTSVGMPAGQANLFKRAADAFLAFKPRTIDDIYVKALDAYSRNLDGAKGFEDEADAILSAVVRAGCRSDLAHLDLLRNFVSEATSD